MAFKNTYLIATTFFDVMHFLSCLRPYLNACPPVWYKLLPSLIVLFAYHQTVVSLAWELWCFNKILLIMFLLRVVYYALFYIYSLEWFLFILHGPSSVYSAWIVFALVWFFFSLLLFLFLFMALCFVNGLVFIKACNLYDTACGTICSAWHEWL